MIQDCGNQQSMLSRECFLWRVRYVLSLIVPLFFNAKTEVRSSTMSVLMIPMLYSSCTIARLHY